jgi:hypothetical protein
MVAVNRTNGVVMERPKRKPVSKPSKTPAPAIPERSNKAHSTVPAAPVSEASLIRSATPRTSSSTL